LGRGSDDVQAIQNDLNIELGYRYRSRAVIPDDAGDQAGHQNPRESKGKPGTRAPHIWLEQDGKQISTLDLFGKNFALLAGPQGTRWSESGAEAATGLGIDLDIYEIDARGPKDPGGSFAEAYGIAPSGAVLVRPDDFVGWRSKDAENASPGTLGRGVGFSAVLEAALISLALCK
jgi:putative polyketide hydroxylase